MDALLAIASKRELRDDYLPDPVPGEVVTRILEAARIAGTSRNRQPLRFVVVQNRGLLDELAATVARATNLQGAPLFVAIAARGEGRLAFDGGRAAQNMMLAAWAEGIGSCPNAFVDPQRAANLLGLHPDQELLIGLTFGVPARKRPPERRTREEWLARADRLPLEELVQAWL